MRSDGAIANRQGRLIQNRQRNNLRKLAKVKVFVNTREKIKDAGNVRIRGKSPELSQINEWKIFFCMAEKWYDRDFEFPQ